jgi:hypothetical protein
MPAPGAASATVQELFWALGHQGIARPGKLGVMTLTLQVPEDLAGRLAAEASRRGMSVEELSAELLAAGLDHPAQRRHLAFVGIGASGSNRGGAQADDLLAEGFGEG